MARSRLGTVVGVIRLLVAPIRSIVRSPLFQLALAFVIVLLLQAAADDSPYGEVSNGLDRLVEATVALISQLVPLKSFTKSLFTVCLTIGYVYVVCLMALHVLRLAVRAVVDLVGWSNAFWLRNTIARERGIEVYRAWLPLERIRPANVSQEQWEATFAWPADNKPPYPPLAQRLLHGVLSYLIVVLGVAVLIQIFTPFPVLTWFAKLVATI